MRRCHICLNPSNPHYCEARMGASYVSGSDDILIISLRINISPHGDTMVLLYLHPRVTWHSPHHGDPPSLVKGSPALVITMWQMTISGRVKNDPMPPTWASGRCHNTSTDGSQPLSAQGVCLLSGIAPAICLWFVFCRKCDARDVVMFCGLILTLILWPAMYWYNVHFQRIILCRYPHVGATLPPPNSQMGMWDGHVSRVTLTLKDSGPGCNVIRDVRGPHRPITPNNISIRSARDQNG